MRADRTSDGELAQAFILTRDIRKAHDAHDELGRKIIDAEESKILESMDRFRAPCPTHAGDDDNGRLHAFVLLLFGALRFRCLLSHISSPYHPEMFLA